MLRRDLMLLLLAGTLSPAQHIQFGSLINNGLPVANPVMDSKGNLVLVSAGLSLGLCCGVGTARVLLLNRYDRDGSFRLLADTGMARADENPTVVAIDGRDRVYIGAEREGRPVVVRFEDGESPVRTEVFEASTRLLGIGFAPNGDVLVVGMAEEGGSVVRLESATLQVAASGSTPARNGRPRAMAVDSTGAVYVAGGGAVTRLSPDLQSLTQTPLAGDATAIRVGRDGAVYVAGKGFVERLGGATLRLPAETVNGLAVDASGRVVMHGVTHARDFPGTGVFAAPCGPDRGEAHTAQFLTRVDAELRGVERSIVATGLVSQGLPDGYISGPVPLALSRSFAVADFDRDEPEAVSCVVSGASYAGLVEMTPGQLVTLFGRGLDGAEVFFDGERADVLAALPEQINVVAPLGLQVNSWMEVRRAGRSIDTRNWRWRSTNPDPLVWIDEGGSLVPLPGVPSVFLADAWNADGERNAAAHPAAAGSWVTVFTTGLGALNGDLPFVVETAGGRVTEVEWATVPEWTAAVYAVRFRIPEAASGAMAFTILPSYVTGDFQPKNFVFVQ